MSAPTSTAPPLPDDAALGHQPSGPALLPRLTHGLIGASLAVPAEVADAFVTGTPGHGGITVEALGRRPSESALTREVYFGNWQRDMSQLLTPVSVACLGERADLLNRLLFEVVDVRAEALFGQRLDRRRFGTYRWEEHVDNPRGFGVAIDPVTWRQVTDTSMESRPEPGDSAWVEQPDGLARYLHSSRAYVRRQLELAVRAGATPRGREHFGNAMHTVEDFYAHSNFVELGVVALGGAIDPMSGWEADGSSVRDLKGRPRLTTGVFTTHDTVVSLQKALLATVEGHPPMPGEPDIGAEVRRVLIRRLLGETALGAHDAALRGWQQSGIPGAVAGVADRVGLTRLGAALTEQVEKPLRRALHDLLHPLVEAAARQPVGRPAAVVIGGVRRTVREVTHSQVAKDDPARPYHRAARQLAVVAVQDHWRELEAAWRSGGGDASARFDALQRRYLAHPTDVGDWWQPVVWPLVPGGRGRRAPRRTSDVGPTPDRRQRAVPWPRPVLRRGSRGPAVRELQMRLNTWLAGRRGTPLRTDGVFGPGTAAAVRSFQRARRLAVDGVVGPRTWRALGSPSAGAPAPAPAPRRAPVPVPAPNPGAGQRRIDWSRIRATPADIVTVHGIRVHRMIAPQVAALVEAAKRDGVVLRSRSDYRDPAEQIRLRMKNCGTSHYAIYTMPAGECRVATAIPGRSRHENGLAIDFVLNMDGSTFRWLTENAGRFGMQNLRQRPGRQPEPWHWSVDGR
jgi:putative peptidoglycan binding protein/heterokaryon incompatibility protein Het-C/D-alanyl-D-alanine carboxypeptidase-like protein